MMVPSLRDSVESITLPGTYVPGYSYSVAARD